MWQSHIEINLKIIPAILQLHRSVFEVLHHRRAGLTHTSWTNWIFKHLQVCVSSALNVSAPIQNFEYSDVVKVCGGYNIQFLHETVTHKLEYQCHHKSGVGHILPIFSELQ